MGLKPVVPLSQQDEKRRKIFIYTHGHRSLKANSTPYPTTHEVPSSTSQPLTCWGKPWIASEKKGSLIPQTRIMLLPQNLLSAQNTKMTDCVNNRKCPFQSFKLLMKLTKGYSILESEAVLPIGKVGSKLFVTMWVPYLAQSVFKITAPWSCWFSSQLIITGSDRPSPSGKLQVNVWCYFWSLVKELSLEWVVNLMGYPLTHWLTLKTEVLMSNNLTQKTPAS